jgi:hypothetical protein
MDNDIIIKKSKQAFSNEILNENYSSFWKQALTQVLPKKQNESKQPIHNGIKSKGKKK